MKDVSLKTFCEENNMIEIYNTFLNGYIGFRTVHVSLACGYILASSSGTGETSFKTFLHGILECTQKQKIFSTM